VEVKKKEKKAIRVNSCKRPTISLPKGQADKYFSLWSTWLVWSHSAALHAASDLLLYRTFVSFFQKQLLVYYTAMVHI
jgi:hypothetical protein